MRELAHSGITMVVVTHEMGFAREVADRMVFMADGAVVQDLPPGRYLAGGGEPRIEAFLAKVR